MKKILIVDDDLYMIKTMKDLLSDRGFSTCSAYNGKLALTLFQEENPDAVLLDLNMPEMDGMEVLHEFKKIEYRIPVVIFTAVNDIPTAVEATKCGAFAYVTKPPDIGNLVTILNQAADYKSAICSTLSPKEMEVLKLISSGMSARQAGEFLGISENTVNFHIKGIKEKLGAKNIAHAVTLGIERGLVSSQPNPEKTS